MKTALERRLEALEAAPGGDGDSPRRVDASETRKCS